MTTTQQYFDARGRPVDETEALDHGILRDGFRMRMPTFMMDSLQRSIAEDGKRKRRKRGVERDPQGRESGSYDEEECDDAAVGFTDSRGVFFAADARMTAAQDALDHLQRREEGLRALRHDGRQAAEQAHREMIDSLAAGRDPTPHGIGSKPVVAARAGDVCMTDDTHAPGHLEMRNGALVCVADKRRTDARSTGDADPCTAAYLEMVADMAKGRDAA